MFSRDLRGQFGRSPDIPGTASGGDPQRLLSRDKTQGGARTERRSLFGAGGQQPVSVAEIALLRELRSGRERYVAAHPAARRRIGGRWGAGSSRAARGHVVRSQRARRAGRPERTLSRQERSAGRGRGRRRNRTQKLDG